MLGNFFKILHDSTFFSLILLFNVVIWYQWHRPRWIHDVIFFNHGIYARVHVCGCVYSLWMLLYKISATFILTQCYQAYTDFLWNHEIMFCSYVLLLPNQITVALFHLLFTTEKLAPIFVLSCWMKEEKKNKWKKKEWKEKCAILFEAESTSKLHLPV